MDSIKTELIDDGQRRDTRGRKITTSERRADLLAAYDASGLTQRAFAQREGINFHTLVVWLQHRRAASAPPADSSTRFREVQLASSPAIAHERSLEVALPGGVIVRGADFAAVAQLVRALRA